MYVYICWVVCNIIIQGYIRVTKFPLAIRTLCLVHCACQIEKIYNVQSSSQWCYRFLGVYKSNDKFNCIWWPVMAWKFKGCVKNAVEGYKLSFFLGTRKMCRFNMPSCLFAFFSDIWYVSLPLPIWWHGDTNIFQMVCDRDWYII